MLDINKNTADVQETKQYEIVRPFDEAQIEDHAAKCGGRRLLKVIEVTTDDDYQFHYLVKRPSRAVLTAIAEKKKGNGNTAEMDVAAIEKLMLGLVLEGDRSALDNDGAISGQLLKKLGGLVSSATSEIKKI